MEIHQKASLIDGIGKLVILRTALIRANGCIYNLSVQSCEAHSRSLWAPRFRTNHYSRGFKVDLLTSTIHGYFLVKARLQIVGFFMFRI